MYESLKFMEDNCDDSYREKFSQLEVDKFSRVVKYMETSAYSEYKILEGRKDFYNWFKEYDRRRGTDFKRTFPEMVNFMDQCGEMAKN